MSDVRLAELRENDVLPQRQHTPSNAELFFYNAALWNAHRIHYDLPYAKSEEGYDGLVIAGPQMGDWLAQTIDNLLADAVDSDGFFLAKLTYSNRAAAYIGETLTTGGVVTQVIRDNAGGPQPGNALEINVELFVKNQEQTVITPGSAVLKRLIP